MAYTSINSTDIEVGKAVKSSLLTTIKDDLDDHESRISALSAAANKVQVIDFYIKPEDLHIGEILTSDMTTAEFQAVHGAGWVLANGQSCTGSVYAAVTGHSIVPDLQDEFLRGASGTRTLGSTQADATAVNGLATTSAGAHTHNTTVEGQKAIAGTSDGGFEWLTSLVQTTFDKIFTSTSNGAHTHPLTGDSETRPQNYAVNFFIKINLSAQDNVFTMIAREDMTIVNALGYIIDNNGLPTSGNLEFDIKKGATRAAMSSIYTVKPTLAYSGGIADGDSTSTGTFISGGASVTQGQWLNLDITSMMIGQSGVYIQVYAEPA